jgi:lysylphosphatidylglycerol synthetase-like protein (DUF2156 family)
VAVSPEGAVSYLELVRAYGVDAVAFQGLGPGMSVWFADPENPGAGAVAYFDTGGAWVAAGGPVAPRGASADVAARFVTAARGAGRRAAFFGVEATAAFPGWPRLPIGIQASASPEEWPLAVGRARSLREQLRRSRAKGVKATLSAFTELATGAPLRAEVDALMEEWTLSRRIEPMGFLAPTDPFVLPEEHRYVVARRAGRVVGLLSAVPAYASQGWLVEHLICARGAPNGTGESMLDALYRSLTAEGRGQDRVSLGLSPLAGAGAGDAHPWQRMVRFVARPLFDFDGLQGFKSRLRPTEWREVWLVAPPRRSRVVALFDSLAAFARGHIGLFAMRSILLHPEGLLWSLSMLVAAWAAVLFGLIVSRRADLVGCSDLELLARLLFRAFEACALLLVARRPSSVKILLLLAVAATDGLLASLVPPDALFHIARIARVVISTASLLTLLLVMRHWRGRERDKTSLRLREVG